MKRPNKRNQIATNPHVPRNSIRTKAKYDYEINPQGIKLDGKRDRNINYSLLFNLISQLLQKQNQVKILEIGAGGGRNLQAIHNRFGNKVELFGTDIGYIATNYAQSLTIGQFRQTRSEEIPFNVNFDLILFIDVMEHLESIAIVQKTLTVAFKHLNRNGHIYLSVPIELNPYSLTWFFSKLPYFRSLTKENFGHLIQYDKNTLLGLINRKNIKLISIYYSVHFIRQIHTLLFFFLPKIVLNTFFNKKVTAAIRDSNEIIGGEKHPFLSFIKAFVHIIGYPILYLALIETDLRKSSGFGAENMHLLMRKSQS